MGLEYALDNNNNAKEDAIAQNVKGQLQLKYVSTFSNSMFPLLQAQEKSFLG